MTRKTWVVVAALLLGCGGMDPATSRGQSLALGEDVRVPGDMIGGAVLVPGHGVIGLSNVSAQPAADMVDGAAMRAMPRELMLCSGAARIINDFSLDDFTVSFWFMPYRLSGVLLSAGSLNMTLVNGYLMVTMPGAVIVAGRPLVRFTQPVVMARPHHIMLTRCGAMIELHIDGMPAGRHFGSTPRVTAEAFELGDATWGACGRMDNIELRADALHLGQFTPPETIDVQGTHVFAFDFDGVANDLVRGGSKLMLAGATLVGPLPLIR